MRRGAPLVAACLLLAGCSGADRPQVKQADAAARPGGVLRVATTTPGTVDPGNVYEPVGDLLTRTLCTPLLAADPQTREIAPSIVSSYTVSDSGTTLTLRLRDDVVFTDGTELTTQDVAYTLSRVASAAYASTSAERLAPILGYEQVHGEVATESDLERRRLSGVQIYDAHNLQIALDEPLSDFLRVLTSPLTAPVSRAAAERDPEGFARSPVCVGPYVLDRPYEPGADSVRLVRSRAYTPVDTSLTGGGAGYADAIEVRFYGSPDEAAAAADRGEADVAPARLRDVQEVQVGSSPMLEYLGLPTTAEGLDDPRVRRAVALAIDRETLVQKVFPRSRRAADGFLPATSPLDDSCDALPPGGDVEAARRLLSEVGIDVAAAPVPLYFNDEFRNGEVARELARQLGEALGVTVVPTALTYEEFLAKANGTTGFDGLFRFSWSVPYADVDGYLHPLFSSDRIGRDNLGRFSDPAVDRTLDRVAREAEDDADRDLGYTQVAELLCDRMPMVPLTTSLSRWLVDGRVGSASGQFVDDATGQPLLRELYLR